LLRSCFIVVVYTSFNEFLFEKPFNLGLVESNAAADPVKWNLSLAAPMSDSPRGDSQKRRDLLNLHDFFCHSRPPGIVRFTAIRLKHAQKCGLATGREKRAPQSTAGGGMMVTGARCQQLKNGVDFLLFGFIRLSDIQFVLLFFEES
jgi:hypothetical protein